MFADRTNSSHHYRKLILSAKCRTARHFTINQSRYWSPIIHHGAHCQSLKLTEAQVQLFLGYKLQSVTRVISRTRCGIPPSPSVVLCSSVTLLWDQFTGVDWLPCPSSLRPIASCACAHPTSAWLILIAVIQSGNLLQPWGDVNDIPQTSGVQRNRKSNFSKSLTMNFLLMFNSRQNRH